MQNLILENQTKIIETIKILVFKENPAIFKNLDFDNDSIFLEPLLFAYFNADKKQISNNLLNEILQGYFSKKEKLNIKVSYNKKQIAYLPKLGYYQSNHKVEDILEIEGFEIIKEIHPLIDKYFTESYKGHLVNNEPIHNPLWQQHYKELEKAILIIKNELPDFYYELCFANKKIYLHDNCKILNFATIETLGMLYLYVLGEKNIIYFIEELIHQGSHNFLYYVMHDVNDFFKIDVKNIVMRDLTNQEWDYRDVFGAFHGLYTVTRRVECFDLLLSKNVFTGRDKHELLGRLSDQFSRFKTGLELLNFDEVYTKKGLGFYYELNSRCQNILEKYQKLSNYFDLSNRDLDFRYNDFCKLNPIEDFYKKEKEGFFKL